VSELVPIESIDLGRSIELSPRTDVDQDTVEGYVRFLDALPPLTLYRVDGQLLVADGLHRLAAFTQAGRDTVPAEVRDGTEEELIEAAVLANLSHGRQWSQEEKRNCVDAWLKIHPERSDNWIAEDLGVSKNTVAARRGHLERTCQIDKLTELVGRDGKTRPRTQARHPSNVPPFEWAPEGYVPPAEMDDREWQVHDEAFRLLRKALDGKVLSGPIEGSPRAVMGQVETRIDWSIHARGTSNQPLDQELIRDYAGAMKAGCVFPPIVVLEDGRVLDGAHRRSALRALGREPETIIVSGLDGDLHGLAISAAMNCQHGLRYTTGELRKVAREHLRTEPDCDLLWLGRTLGLDPDELRKMAKEIGASSSTRLVGLSSFAGSPMPEEAPGDAASTDG